MNVKKYILRNKNFKLGYYIAAATRDLVPDVYYSSKKRALYSGIKDIDQDDLNDRISYYNKMSQAVSISGHPSITSLKELTPPKKARVYYHDIKRYLKFFKNDQHFLYKPGDNIDILNSPAFVKSRPVLSSQNEIILKLNAIRHFNFIQDDIPFRKKKNLLFGRMAVYQDIRRRFFEQHYDNPSCDIGDVAHEMKSAWMKPKVSISEHLKYKFILALEGNDVATNLKWIMSSNSIAVMPEPRYETWFMEGRLIPGVHYISVRKDFSDLNDKLEYFAAHEDECLYIIDQAHQWVNQFRNPDRELLLNLLVMEKYFSLTQSTV